MTSQWINRLITVSLASLIAAACSAPISPTAPGQTPSPGATAAASLTPSQTATSTSTSTPALSATPMPTTVPLWDTPVTLNPIQVRLNDPFSATAELQKLTPAPYKGLDYALPVEPATTANPEVLQGLTPDQLALLSQNGFVVMHSQETDYDTVDSSVRAKGQAEYITSDAALHAFHLTFDRVLKGLERETLRPRMIAIVHATQAAVLDTLDSSKGTPIEADTLLAAAYLGVAEKLFDPTATIDPRIEPQVTAQVAQIMAGGGQAASTLIPGFTDDYGSYKPVGHYAGDPDLENYFRGMTWLGRVHFKLMDPEDPSFVPSRAPLIITMAMRRATLPVENTTAAEAWASIHETLTFMIGPSDDSGPAEYAPLMDAVYGPSLRPSDLADGNHWQDFISRAAKEMPSPRINSTFLNWISQLPTDKGWRFMGQRFTLDGYIFQQLMFDAVKPNGGDRRLLPPGPDIMAALGSPVALKAVDEEGMSNYPNYRDQVAALQKHVSDQPAAQWLARFYDSWLYGFISIVAPKDNSYPAFTQTDAWGFRTMDTALGSWTELKRDTILYTKMPEGMGGGGCGTPTAQIPVYVEPAPDVFYRFAYAATSLTDGLHTRGLDEGSNAAAAADTEPLWQSLNAMTNLAKTLQLYGDIAALELAGKQPSDDQMRSLEFSCLICYDVQNPEPVPVVAAVAGSGFDQILEAGTGYVDRMYAVVPFEGKLYVAQGGVYSYYEFQQPRSDRLTDQDWRDKLKASAPPLPVWTAHYLRPGGQVVNPLVLKVGGVYGLTAAGDNLNVRAQASASAKIVQQLHRGEYFEIKDGPVEADGHRWWNVIDPCYNEFSGWVQENPDWYYWSY